MAGVILMIIVSVLFIVMGVFLCFGKGAFLIAGYNTASEEERKKYDEKKLCKTTGTLCVFVGVMCAGLTVLCYLVEKGKIEEQSLEPVAIAFSALVCIGVVVNIIVSNKYCLKK